LLNRPRASIPTKMATNYSSRREQFQETSVQESRVPSRQGTSYSNNSYTQDSYSRQDETPQRPGATYPPSSRTSTLTESQLHPNLPSYAFPPTRTPGSASSRNSIVGSIRGAYDDPLVSPINGSRSVDFEKRSSPKRGSNKMKWILGIILIGLLVAAAVVVPVYFLVIRPKTSDKVAQNKTGSDSDTSATNSNGSDGGSGPTATSTSGSTATSTPSVVPNRDDPSSLGIPPSAYGTVLDSTKWLDWTDFNVTYTNETIGGLSVMVGSPKRKLTEGIE
jgi:hypothetical protein